MPPRPLACGVVQDSVTERMTIRSSPAHCYEVLTDFHRYPEWAGEIKAVSVEERDDEGRPSLVTYRTAAFGRSTSYTLRYDYSGAPQKLSWVQVSGDLTRRLDGEYVIEATEQGDAEVNYELLVELKVPLPGFVKRRAEGRIMVTALKELRDRVEGS